MSRASCTAARTSMRAAAALAIALFGSIAYAQSPPSTPPADPSSPPAPSSSPADPSTPPGASQPTAPPGATAPTQIPQAPPSGPGVGPARPARPVNINPIQLSP